MEEIKISEFKAKCIEILKRVHQRGVPVSVTLRGCPLVRIEGIKAKADRRLGTRKGDMQIVGDIVHFSFSEDWEIEA